MNSLPTIAEQRAFAEMQARLVTLLLRFDEASFARHYGQRDEHAPAAFDVLRPYRDLAALTLLRDELFDDILPRIVRRLSFEAPRQVTVEELPPRGRVDWERTLDATWEATPGEPPLLVHTRQRRRDFATPENLLAVATLLEYRAELLRVLWDTQVVAQADMLRHPLNAIVTQCERALIFPQFAGIRSEAERIVDNGQIADLVHQVHDRAIPGGNSAYDDLIAWRERLLGLPLLQRDAEAPAVVTLGADPQRDNYLYQIWIFYELADMLSARGNLSPGDLSLSPMSMRFTWRGRTYELRHDQTVPQPMAAWAARPNGGHRAPGVRPDFYIQRVDPPVERVYDGEHLVWREPGVVWDAKYYREREAHDAPASPIKRMIADLTLLGEPYGALLFAFYRGSADGEQYTLAPSPAHDQTIIPGQVISVQALRPALPGSTASLHSTLEQLLDDLHKRLSEPRIPRCHGIFLDALSAAEQAWLIDRWGTGISGDTSELLICPKPHIGPWRLDLVSRSMHCCRDPRLCHIAGQAGAQKPVRPPRDIEGLLTELEQILNGADHQHNDEVVSAIAERVQQLTRRFAEFIGVDFEFYFNRLRDLGMVDTLELLDPIERESLALSEFLKDQLDMIKARDFSAPAIHISGVIEVELKRRVFACPGLIGELANPKRQTLGVLPHLRRSGDPDGNWERIQAYVAEHWNEHPDPEDPERVVRFDDFITKALTRISQLRNTAAHSNPLSRKEYTSLQALIFQGDRLGYSALNALLRCWRSIPPVTLSARDE